MKIRVFAVVSALMLTACVKDGKMTFIDDLGNTFSQSSQTGLSSEEIAFQKSAKAYSQARLIGTAGGAVAGVAACKLAMKRKCGAMEMLMFATGGAVLGNAAADKLTKDHEEFAVNQDSLNNHIARAKAENTKFSEFVSNTGKLVKVHEKKIQSLKAAAKDNESKLAELKGAQAKVEKHRTAIKEQIKLAEARTKELESQVVAYEKEGYDPKEIQLAIKKKKKILNILIAYESSLSKQSGNAQTG